ncbi:MAG: RHS repeat protein [Phenylobacterium sp.]|nr:RHS repeat protein [Phenylobacterium sp.]MCW5758226.1 RHS repeat protein [Phenylobacterium sp.]
MEQLTAPNTQTSRLGFAYDALSRLASVSRGNGVVTTYAYDPAGRLAGLSHTPPDAAQGSYQIFGYNAAGQLVRNDQVSEQYVWSGHPTTTTNFTHDALNRDAAIAAARTSRGMTSGRRCSGLVVDDERAAPRERGPVGGAEVLRQGGRVDHLGGAEGPDAGPALVGEVGRRDRLGLGFRVGAGEGEDGQRRGGARLDSLQRHHEHGGRIHGPAYPAIRADPEGGAGICCDRKHSAALQH